MIVQRRRSILKRRSESFSVLGTLPEEAEVSDDGHGHGHQNGLVLVEIQTPSMTEGTAVAVSATSASVSVPRRNRKKRVSFGNTSFARCPSTSPGAGTLSGSSDMDISLPNFNATYVIQRDEKENEKEFVPSPFPLSVNRRKGDETFLVPSAPFFKRPQEVWKNDTPRRPCFSKMDNGNGNSIRESLRTTLTTEIMGGRSQHEMEIQPPTWLKNDSRDDRDQTFYGGMPSFSIIKQNLSDFRLFEDSPKHSRTPLKERNGQTRTDYPSRLSTSTSSFLWRDKENSIKLEPPTFLDSYTTTCHKNQTSIISSRFSQLSLCNDLLINEKMPIFIHSSDDESEAEAEEDNNSSDLDIFMKNVKQFRGFKRISLIESTFDEIVTLPPEKYDDFKNKMEKILASRYFEAYEARRQLLTEFQKIPVDLNKVISSRCARFVKK